jgi:hypothetical protein
MLTLRAQIDQGHKKLTKAQERTECHLPIFRQSLKAEIGTQEEGGRQPSG